MFLAHLMRGASRVHFSLDADPGPSTAVFASWSDKVKARKIDVAVISCYKTDTIDEKNAQVMRASKLKDLAIEQYPKLHPYKALLTYFVDNSILGKLNGARRAWTCGRGDRVPVHQEIRAGKEGAFLHRPWQYGAPNSEKVRKSM